MGLGVRAYLEERRERLGSRRIVEEDEEEEEEGNGEGDEEEEDGGEERERERKRKRRAEGWNVGEMLRRRFGVDPVLCEFDSVPSSLAFVRSFANSS